MEEENNQYELIKVESKNTAVARTEYEGLKGVISKSADQQSLRNTIKFAVAKAFFSTGKPLDIKEGTFIIDELKAEILRVFPGIRLEEIGLAIHRGAMGEFGQVYNLSLATFVGWIRSYMSSEQRISAAKIYLKGLLIETSTKPSEEEICKMKRQNILNAYDFYKKNKYYNDYGNVILHYLVSYGGIVSFTDDQKNDIWKQARHNVFKLLTSPSRSMDERAEKKLLIDEIKKDKEHPRLYTEAKKIALNMVFKDLYEMNMDLNDMIS